MKKEYSTPRIEFEQYSLTTQIAGACKNNNKIPVKDAEPISLNGKKVHCVSYSKSTNKNCSEGAHTWTISMDGTIFADGSKPGGCTHDVYTLAQYVDLLQESLTSGSTVSGYDCGDYFAFKGASSEHTGSIEGVDYHNYFKS